MLRGSRTATDVNGLEDNGSLSGFQVMVRLSISHWLGGSFAKPLKAKGELRRRFSAEDFKREGAPPSPAEIDPSEFGPVGSKPPTKKKPVQTAPATTPNKPAPARKRMVTELSVRQAFGGWMLGIDGDTISGIETLTFGLARRGREAEWKECPIGLRQGQLETTLPPQHSFVDGMERATAFVSLEKLESWLEEEQVSIGMCESFRRMPRSVRSELRENLAAFRRGVDFALNVPEEDVEPAKASAEAAPNAP